jgi:hypothetical protein
MEQRRFLPEEVLRCCAEGGPGEGEATWYCDRADASQAKHPSDTAPGTLLLRVHLGQQRGMPTSAAWDQQNLLLDKVLRAGVAQ